MRSISIQRAFVWILFGLVFYCLTAIGAVIAQTKRKASDFPGHWNQILIEEAQRDPWDVDLLKVEDAIEGAGMFRLAASSQAKYFALYEAIKNENLPFIKFLLNHSAGSELKLVAKTSNRFLYFAAEYADDSTFRYFLEAFESKLLDIEIFSLIFKKERFQREKVLMLLKRPIFGREGRKIELNATWHPTINFFAEKEEFWVFEELMRGSQESYVELLNVRELNQKARSFLSRWSSGLHLAVKNRSLWDSLRNSLKEIDLLNGEGETPLMTAIAEGNISTAELFLKEGANPNFQTKIGRSGKVITPLGYLLNQSRYEDSQNKEEFIKFIDLLFQYGADIKVDGSRFEIHSWLERPHFIGLLLERGADKNALDENNRSAVSIAAGENTPQTNESLKLLIEAGADLDISDKQAKTALDYSIESLNASAFRALFLAGADLNLSSPEKPLLKTLEKVKKELEDRSLSRGTRKSGFEKLAVIEKMIQFKNPVIEAAVLGDLEKLSEYLKQDFSFETRDLQDQHILLAALRADQLEPLKLLLEKDFHHSIQENEKVELMKLLRDKNQKELVINLFREGFRFEDRLINLEYANSEPEFAELEASLRKEIFISDMASLTSPILLYQDPLDRSQSSAFQKALSFEITDVEIWNKVKLELPRFNQTAAIENYLQHLEGVAGAEEIRSRLQQELDFNRRLESDMSQASGIFAAHLLSFRDRSKHPLIRDLNPSEALKRWNHFVEKVRAQQPRSGDLLSLKLAIEEVLRAVNNDKNVKYNRASVSIFDPICDARLQCYSGTVLFHETAKALWGKDYSQAEPVTIFLRAHVLPGFARRNYKTNEFEIFGIESTAEGEALLSFGRAAQLADEDMPAIRVFMEKSFFNLEHMKFKGSSIENIQEETLKALKLAATRYGLPLEKMEEKVQQEMASANYSVQSNDDLNSSPWGFGEAHVSEGDQERQKIDFQSARGSSEALPEWAARAFEPSNGDWAVSVDYARRSIAQRLDGFQSMYEAQTEFFELVVAHHLSSLLKQDLKALIEAVSVDGSHGWECSVELEASDLSKILNSGKHIIAETYSGGDFNFSEEIKAGIEKAFDLLWSEAGFQQEP